MTRSRLNGGSIGLNNSTSLSSAYGVFALAEQQYYVQANKWPTVPPGTINISNSLRWRSSASAYMTRTPAVAGNRQKFTMSMWIKRGTTTSTGQWIFGASSGSANQDCYLCWGGSTSTGGAQDTLAFFSPPAGNNISLITTALYRDFAAWYHIVCAVDTTQATAANRILLYVNGAQVTSFSTATSPTLDQNLNFNNTQPHLIGSASITPANFLDGYLAEFNYVDGQQLTASSFGNYDGNGIWQPSGYNGSYGTTGFHLTFGNTTSTSTLGNDTSGNSNNFTTNNFSLTAGSTYDAMLDSPTPYTTTVGNYAVINPVGGPTAASITNGNLAWTGATGSLYNLTTTMAIPQTGKWYMEVTANGTTTRDTVGMVRRTTGSSSTTMPDQYNDGSWVFIYTALGYLRNYNQNLVATYSTITSGQTVGVAFDADTGKVWLNINGTYANSGNPVAGTGQVLTITTGVDWQFCVGHYGDTANSSANFGQRPFALTVPSGFNALNTYNLPTPTIANGAQYMAATLYTGNGSSPRSITNGGNNTIGTTFAPDFVWIKDRSTASFGHNQYDVLRGVGKLLISNATAAEITNDVNGYVSSFDSSGFTLTAGSSGINGVNANTDNIVGWQWKANGAGVSNTNGSITSTVSANTTAGFSIVTYTGTGANATVGHGLGVTPSLVIWKNRSAVTNWIVWHSSLGGNALNLNTTAAQFAQGNYFPGLPYSVAINVGTDSATNGSGNSMLAYCWSAVSGYSAFGSYTGNGSTDGPFVYTGFRPRFLLVKRTDTVESWNIVDTSRDTYNQAGTNLYPNLANAESTNNLCDLLSNGFKLRNTWTGANTSGGTYIYAAFAENPFNSSRAR